MRTRLSGEGMLRLEEFFGEPQRTVVGEVVEAQNGSLLLLTRTRFPVGMTPVDPRLRQRLVIESQEIMEVEQRLLDRKRTSAFVSALGVGAGALLYHFLTAESRGRGAGDPVPGEEMARIPLLSW